MFFVDRRERRLKSRMFPFITHTVNPLAGGPCPHKCSYCWATNLKNRHKWEKYTGPWRIYEKELKQYKAGDFVFPFDMTDIGCHSIPSDIIHELLNWMRNQPEVKFLLMTKDPEFYATFDLWIPHNCVLGVTIETDIKELTSRYSLAPFPNVRMVHMKNMTNDFDTFISVEPIMKFSPLFANNLSYIRPWAVAVGYDNYNNNLPEPSLTETKDFITKLERYTTVYLKTLREANHQTLEETAN